MTLADELRRDVDALASGGPRHVLAPASLRAAADYIHASLERAGHHPRRHLFPCYSLTCENIEVELPGAARAGEIVVIGAHYDTVPDSPGADDNGSGVAGLLAMARALRGAPLARTVRLVAFANEEAPHFGTPQMGSYVYAQAAHQRGEQIVAMLSLETIGYYSDEPRSQRYPPPLSLFYPSRGNFIGFAGNLRSRRLVHECARSFRKHTHFPAEAAAVPPYIEEVAWSDQWSFWQFGWPAVMVTDTAMFRNPHYHGPTDTPETLDYERLARVVEGLTAVVSDLAGR